MSNFIIDSSKFAEPCEPELWSQTTGTGVVGFNDSGVVGLAMNINAGSSVIDKTITSFKMNLRRTNTNSTPLSFGVFSKDGATPSTTFTSTESTPITNSNQLSESFTWYTFINGTGHTLAQDEHVGFIMTSNPGSNLEAQRIEDVGESTVSNLSMVIYGHHVKTWWNYSLAQIPYHEGFQTS